MKKIVFMTCLVLTQISTYTIIAMIKDKTIPLPVAPAGLYLVDAVEKINIHHGPDDDDLAKDIKKLRIYTDPDKYDMNDFTSMTVYLEHTFAQSEHTLYRAARQKTALYYEGHDALFLTGLIHAYILFAFTQENMIMSHLGTTNFFFLDFLNYYFTQHAKQCTACAKIDPQIFARLIKLTTTFNSKHIFTFTILGQKVRESLLHAAVRPKYVEVILMLLYLGLDPNAKNSQRFSTIKLAHDCAKQINHLDLGPEIVGKVEADPVCIALKNFIADNPSSGCC